MIPDNSFADSKLDILFRKDTWNLYWNRILSDKIEDSHGDNVFSERERKTNLPKKIRRFPSSSPSNASASHHFFGQITN